MAKGVYEGQAQEVGNQSLCAGCPTGYCYRFKISGDALPDEETEADDMADGIGMSGRTVLSLVRDVPPGCEVFFDNWFASPALLLRLK